MLQINNPTDGTVWKTSFPSFVGWSGNCASMGNDSKAVKVDLVNGPPSTVRYVATLGTLDCSGSNTRADMTIPSTVPSGQYAIVVRTFPQQSYTNSFQIDNPSMPSAAGTSSHVANVEANGAAGSATAQVAAVGGALSSSPSPSLGAQRSNLATRAMLVLAGATSLGFQFL